MSHLYPESMVLTMVPCNRMSDIYPCSYGAHFSPNRRYKCRSTLNKKDCLYAQTAWIGENQNLIVSAGQRRLFSWVRLSLELLNCHLARVSVQCSSNNRDVSGECFKRNNLTRFKQKGNDNSHSRSIVRCVFSCLTYWSLNICFVLQDGCVMGRYDSADLWIKWLAIVVAGSRKRMRRRNR